MATTGARVGERLRAIRRQKGLSLHDVEARSTLEFKASVLGAYERGERAISVPRLAAPGRDLRGAGRPAPAPRVRRRDQPRRRLDAARSTRRAAFAIDLVRLHDVDDPDAQMLSRFASSIQLERQDFNGRMLTIRRSDLRVLAACMGRSLEDLGVPARAARPPRRGLTLTRRERVSPSSTGRAGATLSRTLVAPRTTSPPPTT